MTTYLSRTALAFSLLFAGGCAGLMAAAPFLLKIGQNLLGVAEENYDIEYAGQIKTLLTALTDANAAKTTTVASATPERESAQPEKPLALDVAVMVQRPGTSEPVPVEDGTVVHDGDGDASKADRLKMVFSVSEACHLYVIAIDSTGWVTPVFPSAESGRSNPVSAGREIRVPEAKGRWFALDEYKGVETFYFLASRTPRDDIRELLEGFAKQTRPNKPVTRRVEEPAVATRGIYATGEGAATTVQSPTGASHEIIPTEFLTDAGSLDLVVTRWLDHR